MVEDLDTVKLAESQEPSVEMAVDHDSDIESSGLEGERPQGEQFFRQVLESLPYPQYLIRVDDLKVIWKNLAAGKSQAADGTACYSYIRGRNRPCAQAGSRQM